ncbi:MAG TPA: hypothetical protein PLE92_01245 [Lentisphaeria bacterium]|nr:hypothetical protein [Lentisphaerota bacterium]OQC16369.1 MAG: hypothetical protein BWX73_00827 [Lentisphaerae bacterium ADurb.Bin082]HQC51729.1 hypothetical protein [Lentisphaeria bacterium]HQL88856.1 hypothetical protein [Lentisphaeria bacterium]
MSSFRIHVQTLSELNHCVGTARRNAAFIHLGEIAQPGAWQETCKGRHAMYACYLELIQEVLTTTEKSSLMHCIPKHGLWDRPVLHFLNLLHQLAQTLSCLAEHVSNVKEEAELLAEHLGQDTFTQLQATCNDFEQHEKATLQAFLRILAIGATVLNDNSAKRCQQFSADETRRYNLAFEKYLDYYRRRHGHPTPATLS